MLNSQATWLPCEIDALSKLGFHSHDQQPCFLSETTKKIALTIVSLFRGSNMATITSANFISY